ncbi:hypothetical protein [Emcibacter nanhaiensis]|uniref:DUF4062 domain-containing protein n=1 Tax=Emcibacter nanhaiensis TaxID=1505037 RepID=A0A501PG46_9PROT|nr:hypothetical protein [Emcibacter nanhaiensis]TPD58972.1 hypothetical protein FIV46_12095 [Emcibacter nanhaiensis]
MPRAGQIYRILIASPSDCVKERAAIPQIIYAWNAAHSLHSDVILEPIMWESHVVPELGGRPQEIINNQIVASCDFLIGAFWTRIGTATGNHISGTAEEIDLLRKQGKKTLLYFSSAPVMPESIDAEQYKALKEFKDGLREQGITFEYSDIGEFREMLQRHISSIMAEILKNQAPLQSSQDQEENGLEMFRSQFESFSRRFRAEWAAERDSEPMSIEEAQYIISSAVDDLLNFQAQITSDPQGKLIPKFEHSTKALKTLLRHQVYLDGGKSFREFWEKGDRAIESLQEISNILSSSKG